MQELGSLADKISEADVSDLDDLKVTEKLDGRAVTLMLGEHNFTSRLAEFPGSLSGHPSQNPASHHLRLAAGRQNHGSGGGQLMPEKPQLAVGLDAGSAFTRCVILAMEEGRLRYLGHGEVPSSGWHKSRLTDQQALTRCRSGRGAPGRSRSAGGGGCHGGGHRRRHHRRPQQPRHL